VKNTFFTILLFLLAHPLISQENGNSDITICWDTSLSMGQRNLEKDLGILTSYFEENANARVQVIYFNVHTTQKNYEVFNGDWNELKSDLQAIVYDGATVYGNLKDMIKHPNLYVFTDGNKLLERDNLILQDKSVVINSSPDGNRTYLERTALLNRAKLVDVIGENGQSIITERSSATENLGGGILKGTVYIDNKPAPEAKVAVKGISDSFLTDAGGGFSIKAKVGDTLLVTSVKSRTMKMLPIEKMSHTSVFLQGNLLELDEVVLVEKRQEEALEMVNTGFAAYDKNRLGYGVVTVSSDEISAIETNAGDALRNKVPGVNIDNKGYTGTEGGLAKTRIRGNSSLFMNEDALVVIDGVPTGKGTGVPNVGFETSGASVGNVNHIDPNNIDKITVLKGLAATNQWGSAGANGVILITTKTAQGEVNGKKSTKIIDRARLKDNIYEGSEFEMSGNESAILKALTATKTLEEAYDTYLTLRNVNLTDPTFYLDAFFYFKTKDKRCASRIVSNLWEIEPKNVQFLRMVAMALATLGHHEIVKKMNEELISISPNDVNAHLNAAIALKDMGKAQEALDELMVMTTGGPNASLNTSGIMKTLDREIKNVLSQNKGSLKTAHIDPKYSNTPKYKVRLVFEWNHPGAEFELQFVNPQNRFFSWTHTTAELGKRIQNEIQHNYRIEEFELFGDVQGKWVFNAELLEDLPLQSQVPFLLKCTVYTNFGYPEQQKEDIMLSFTKRGEKSTIKQLVVR
jgi:TonB-dependent SusC/RagA subfamily outer membrane receptor